MKQLQKFHKYPLDTIILKATHGATLCVMQNVNKGQLNKAIMPWWSLGGGRKFKEKLGL